MRQSVIDYHDAEVATINAAETTKTYVDAIIARSQAAAADQKAEEDRAAALLAHKDAQAELGQQSELTADQVALVTTTMLDVQRALELAENEYTRTGDQSAYLASQQEILQGAIETLAGSGIPAASGAFEQYTGTLSDVEAQLGYLKTAQELAGDATINVANVLGEAGDKGSAYAAIMEGIRAANEDAAVTARLFGDEQGALEAQIANTEAAIVAAAAAYGENSRTVQELQGNLQGYKRGASPSHR